MARSAWPATDRCAWPAGCAAPGGAPALSGRDPFGHILWLRHERPEVYDAAAVLLEPADWLGLCLTGRAATTAVTATLHWLTDTRDLHRIRYDDGLLRAAGVDAAKLPELLPTNTVLGPLAPNAAEALGLAAGVPVVAGTPDTMSAAVGAGAVADGAAHLYVGTSSWLSCHVDFKRTDPQHGIASPPSALPGRYLVSDEQEAAGASAWRSSAHWSWSRSPSVRRGRHAGPKALVACSSPRG